ncbi:hypothetical protein [Paraglaciecola chathamensis]|nr:hypothetical protein [Paraglaciecola chathamensis]MDO6559452.1 hypothetical protein [Paraglaciecola chathamensis]
MMKLVTVLLVLFLAGCGSTSSSNKSSELQSQTAQVDEQNQTTDTMAYRNLAAVIYPKSFETGGIFKVKATGNKEGHVFLNTQYDYRDPRNITIVIPPEVASELEENVKMSPEAYFLKKRILVKGSLVQVKVWFSANGKRTNKYYYQTHMRVASWKDINLVGETSS